VYGGYKSEVGMGQMVCGRSEGCGVGSSWLGERVDCWRHSGEWEGGGGENDGACRGGR